MAEREVRMDLRAVVATWPVDAPRGAVSRFCAANGVSRSWFYGIRARVAAEGEVAAMRRRSSRPVRSPGQTPAEIEELAVRIRKELEDDGWDAGPVTVRAHLVELGLPKVPSRAALARLFARRGLITPQPQKRPHASWRRFTFAAPNECWQLDGTQWQLRDGEVVTILQVLDDHSRRLLASLAAPGETARDALTVVETAIAAHGLPQRLLTDNGSAFNPSRRGAVGLLTSRMRELGVQPISSSPHHPQTCGKNERVHATTKRWLEARPRARTLTELPTQLDAFDAHYNTRRPHQALDGRTPLQVWQATAPADPPSPATPSARPRRTPRLARQTRVASNGNIGAGGVSIQVGSALRGQLLTVVVDGHKIIVFDPAGEHVRTVERVPGKYYYGNGVPRGGYRGRRRETSTLS